MHAELLKLSVEDDIDIYNMLQELPRNENGFVNSCNGRSYDEYKKWLVKCDNTSKGIGLEDWMVPQDTYWLYVDGNPVGIGKLRHFLTEKLRAEGGHVGYAIRPTSRSRGYGTLLLKLLVKEAGSRGIERILVTIENHNTDSIRVALRNAGVIEKITEVRHLIWIECPSAVEHW